MKLASNNYKINEEFVKEVEENTIKLQCRVNNKVNPSTIRNELYGFSATLGGVYNDDFNGLSNEFTIYIWKNLIKQKYEYNGKITSHFKRVKNKYKMLDISIKNREGVLFNELPKEKREYILLRAIKAQRSNSKLRELINYSNSTIIDDNKILTTFLLSIISKTINGKDEYYLTIHPKYNLISQMSIYDILNNNIIKEEVLLDNLKNKKWSITTKRNGVKQPKNKVSKIIKKTEFPELYEKYVQDINKYYLENKINIQVGLGKDEYQYIFLTEGDIPLPYHSENALLYRSITKSVRKYILKNNTFLKNLSMGRDIGEKSGIILPNSQLKVIMHKVNDIPVIFNTKHGKTTKNYLELMYLFNWVWDENQEVYYPCRIAPILNELPINIYIFYDESVDELALSKFIELLNTIKKSYKSCLSMSVCSSTKCKFSKMKLNDIKNIISSTISKNGVSFIFTIIPYLKDNDFNSLKSFLFSAGWFHQSMYPDNINNYKNERMWKSYMNSILSQFFHKIGVYLYSLSDSLTLFDYIIGYDITKEKINRKMKGIGGSAIVYNNEGHALSVVPFSSIHTSSEIAAYGLLFDTIKDQLILNNDDSQKKFLLLKDGAIFNKELKELKELCVKHNFVIQYMDVRKSSPVRFFNNNATKDISPEKNSYCNIGTDWYFTSHYYTQYLKKPIKVRDKYFIIPTDGGKINPQPVTFVDIEKLIILSKLNFTNSAQPDKTREPCPTHYAHKYINAVRRGWVMDKKWLEYGCLYFI